MTGSKDGMQSLFLLAGLAVVVVALSYLQPNLFVGGREGFQSTLSAASNTAAPAGSMSAPGPSRERAVKTAPEVAPMQPNGPADFGSAESPAGCYPRDQLTPSELLPKDSNSVWAEQNPMGTGSLKGKNFLSAGALIGVNTVGQTLRNANYQLRSEPPNPQVPVSVFNVPTIEPDMNRRALEIA
uniref:Minor capsid protein P11 C-terminal conserved region domain-containing protein n=1 Tax=viral metagenome TaxID=1070528 RepID=A0A6C0DCV4_9ZZZZ